MNTVDRIEKVCYKLEGRNERIKLVKTMTTAEGLYSLLDHYNWDDGFEIPTVIANHPAL
jgi:hypothetical protein